MSDDFAPADGTAAYARQIAKRFRNYLGARNQMLGLPQPTNVIHRTGGHGFSVRTIAEHELTTADIAAAIDMLDPPDLEDRYDEHAAKVAARPAWHSDDDPTETHPSWGVAVLNRFTTTGASFFQSDINHHEGISLSIHRADRRRSLGRDWVHPGPELVEVVMSYAQWGQLISSMGLGGGVPVTIHALNNRNVAQRQPESRLALSVSKVKSAADDALAHIREAFEALEASRRKEPGAPKPAEALAELRRAIEHAPGNMVYAAKTLNEHVENVMGAAQSDIEAWALDAARRAGLPPIEPPQLTIGQAPEIEAGS